MGLRSIVIMSGFISLIVAAPTPKPPACDTCSTQLMDYLREIRSNIDYANKTVGKDRLSSELSLRLDDLDSSINDHEIAYKKSSDMLNNSIIIFGNSSHKSPNEIVLDAQGLLKNLQNDCALIDSELGNLQITNSELNYILLLLSSVFKLDSKLGQQLAFLGLFEGKFKTMEENYELKTINLKARFPGVDEMGDKNLGISLKETENMLRSQNDFNLVLNRSFIELDRTLKQTVELHRQSIQALEFDSEKFIVDTLFNTTSSSSESNRSRQIESLFDLLQLKLNKSVSLCQNTSYHVTELSKLIESNAACDVDENRKLDAISSSLNFLESKLGFARQIFDNSVKLLNGLRLQLEINDWRQMPFLTEVALDKLGNFTSKLTKKNRDIKRWMQVELYTAVNKLYNETNGISKTHNELFDGFWLNPLLLNRRIDKTIRLIESVDAAVISIDKFVADPENSMKKPSNTQLKETKELNLVALKELRALIETAKQATFLYLRQMNLDERSLNKLSGNVKLFSNTDSEILNDVASLNEVTSGTINLTIHIKDYVNRFSPVLKRLSVNKVGLLSSKGNESTSLSIAIWDHLRRVDNRTMMPDELNSTSQLFDKLQARLQNKLNYDRVTNVSRFASLDMRQSIEKLHQKIDYARLMINQMKLSRRFEVASTSVKFGLKAVLRTRTCEL